MSLVELRFHHRFHDLGSGFYTVVNPHGVTHPKLVCGNSGLAQQCGLNSAALTSDYYLQLFSGNQLLESMQPLAQAYAGHQLGKFNPFLGDGRSLLLGEINTVQGDMEVYLKGSGKTPYARQADGRASLSECLHEYQISEQLAALNVPTTRSLCVIQGSEWVYRHSFEPVAILVRIAPSHIRFGSFELYYFKREYELLQQLTDFVIKNYYPSCLNSIKPYAAFFQAVVERTAQLIAHWQNVGFVHGMMNTDNQSILGISLDLGESAFNPERKPDFVSSLADEKGRYAFAEQPVVGLWNCNILARALSPLIEAEDLKIALETYEPNYLAAFESPT